MKFKVSATVSFFVVAAVAALSSARPDTASDLDIMNMGEIQVHTLIMLHEMKYI